MSPNLAKIISHLSSLTFYCRPSTRHLNSFHSVTRQVLPELHHSLVTTLWRGRPRRHLCPYSCSFFSFSSFCRLLLDHSVGLHSHSCFSIYLHHLHHLLSRLLLRLSFPPQSFACWIADDFLRPPFISFLVPLFFGWISSALLSLYRYRISHGRSLRWLGCSQTLSYNAQTSRNRARTSDFGTCTRRSYPNQHTSTLQQSRTSMALSAARKRAVSSTERKLAHSCALACSSKWPREAPKRSTYWGATRAERIGWPAQDTAEERNWTICMFCRHCHP